MSSGRGWEDDYLNEEICRFPKYREDSLTWYAVIQRDRSYVRWILENVEDLDEELRETLQWGVDHVPDRI